MSVRVTVNSNHSSDCNRRLLVDVETEKRNEWNRRRLLRIQQVRQQSKDFANSLREKIHGECDLQKENSNKQWQEKTLDRLTDKYRDCLKDIGLAHAKAARQPDPDEILREERLKNALITGIRGESAMCLLKCRQQMKKLEETVPTRLKAYVRAKEDLRSTMIASLPQPQPRPKKSPVKKKFSPVKRRVVATKQKKPRHILKEIPSNLPEDYATVIERVPDDDKVERCCGGGGANAVDDEDDYNERQRPESPKYKCHCSPKKTKVSEVPGKKSAKPTQPSGTDADVDGACCPTESRRQRRYSGDLQAASDLDDSYDSDTTWPPRSRRSSSSGHVHCYDHRNRHHTSRPAESVTSSHVRRVEGVERGVRAAHEADMRVRQCEERCREEQARQQVRRGEEALLRQQRRNDFDKLMLELSKLSREERKLRYTNWTKTSPELGDTQRKMATKIRQKKMESAFEMEFMEPVVEDDKKKETAGTPKLNVAEWKKSERSETLEVSRAKQNDILTLSNLMKRINEQRESLFQEIREDVGERERATEKPDGKIEDKNNYSNCEKPCYSTTSNMPSFGAKYNPDDFTEQNSRNSKIVGNRGQNTQETEYGKDYSDYSRQTSQSGYDARKSMKLNTLYGFEGSEKVIPILRKNMIVRDRELSSQQNQLEMLDRGPSGQTIQYGNGDRKPKNLQSVYGFGVKPSEEQSETQLQGDSSGRYPTNRDAQEAAKNTASGYRSSIEKQIPQTQRGPCFCGSTVEKVCKCSTKIGKVEKREETNISSRIPAEPREEVSCICEGRFGKQCVCSKSSDSVFGEKCTNPHTSSDYRIMNRIRLPSPILEVSETSYKQDDDAKERSSTKSNKVDKTVEKRNFSETADKKGEKVVGNNAEDGKNSDSSLSTLYSLDMALSQVEKNDEKEDGFSAAKKELRITVKVTGGKEFKDKKNKKKAKTEDDKFEGKKKTKAGDELEYEKRIKARNDTLEDKMKTKAVEDKFEDKKKKKTKTEEEKLLKECQKLLEDGGNVRKRNLSGETTSTSYRSPPERLSPKQLQLLRDLLKQIESKPDEKGMPLLKKYILRLLSMRRESIDCLGVSSSDVSLQSSLVREMVGNLEDSRNLDEDITMKEKGVQVSLVESSTKNVDRKSSREKDKTSDKMKHKKMSKIDEDDVKMSFDKSGKQKRNKNMETNQQSPDYYQGVTADDTSMLDDLDVLTQQINKYFETKQNDKSDEIVKKYMELAKRYTDRISNLADLIGDVETDLPSSLIRSRSDEESNESSPADSKDRISPVESCERSSLSPVGSQTYNETSYMTLPPEVNVPLPTRRSEPLQRISPTFNEDKQRDVSWHEALSHPLPTHISPAPDESKWFRPKPPPTILNNNNNHLDPDLRTSSPHELSTIHEVDTPSTSWRRDLSQQMVTSSPRKQSSLPSGYRLPPPDESIPLDNAPPVRQKVSSDESFQTMKSDDNSGEMDMEEKDILDESMPDVMQELIRRNIMSSPYGWLKEMQERERATQETADEEVRRIMMESPEDLEAALKNLGIGWASTTLRKTRQAGELSGDSSSPPNVVKLSDESVVRVGTTMETSTPQSGKPVAWPVVGSETEISAIRLIASSSSDLALTPPDISLKQPQLSLSSNSSNS